MPDESWYKHLIPNLLSNLYWNKIIVILFWSEFVLIVFLLWSYSLLCREKMKLTLVVLCIYFHMTWISFTAMQRKMELTSILLWSHFDLTWSWLLSYFHLLLSIAVQLTVIILWSYFDLILIWICSDCYLTFISFTAV